MRRTTENRSDTPFRWSTCAALTLLALTATASRAEMPVDPAPAEAEVPVDQSQIARWLTDLGRAEFGTRREATRRLIDAGPQAVDAVARAAATSDLETAARCVDVLKRMMKSDRVEVRASAENALKKLSENSNLSVAQRAADATRKPDPIADRRDVFGRGFGAPIVVGVAPAPIVFGPPVREATVKKDGKSIHVKETFGPNRKIEVKTTETIKGEEKTTVVTVANLAELRRLSPEGFDVYLAQVVRKPVVGAAPPVAGPVPAKAAIRRLVPALPGAPAVPGAVIEARNLQVRVKSANGQRTIEVDEDGQKIEISDKDGKDIVVKETRTVDGKPKTTEATAKDVEELKKNHPEAAKTYEKYGSSTNGRIRVLGAGPGAQIQGEIRLDLGPRRYLAPQALPAFPVPQRERSVEPKLPEAAPPENRP
jgi:hypothetical protein